MNGILNILKPPGMTSFDVVAFLRGITKIKKIGHTGTLDPDAVGVLPICIGKATKAIDYITNKNKTYRAEIILGIDTDTQDASGKIIKTREVNITYRDFEDITKSFIGTYDQIPPMYSAVKVNGKKLYELARQGVEIERKHRTVEILSIKIIHTNFNDNNTLSGTHSKVFKALIDIECSKGTYIRTLCSDIGEKCGCGAHMSFLIRTKSGEFDINSATTLEEILEMKNSIDLKKKLLTVDAAFTDLSYIELNLIEESKFMNGGWIKGEYINSYGYNDIVKVYNRDDDFLGLGEIVEFENSKYLKSKKVFV